MDKAPLDRIDPKEQIFNRAYDGKLVATNVEAIGAWIGNGEELPILICNLDDTPLGEEEIKTFGDFEKKKAEIQQELERRGGVIIRKR